MQSLIVLKPKFDAISSRMLRFAAKLGLCTVTMGLLYALLLFVFKLPAVVQEVSGSAPWLLAATVLVGLVLFFVYDLAIDRVDVIYAHRRKKR